LKTLSPALVLVTTTVLFACTADDQRTGDFDLENAARLVSELSPEVRAMLERGNVAYKADDFETARDEYRAAVEADAHASAAWFGLYMAESRLGNEAAADSALGVVRGLQPGASLVHPDDGGNDP
jgi:hypothetical protein